MVGPMVVLAGCGGEAPSEPEGADLKEWVAVAAGLSHACALTAEGTAWCWGANDHGQLGNGTTTPTAVPLQVQGAPAFVALDAGDESTCGRTAGGTLHCWGRNDVGQLGDGTLQDRSIPVPSLAGPFESVSVGSYMACGIVAGGGLWCWGGDRFDVVLAGGTEACTGVYATPLWRCASVPIEVAAAGGFRSVSVGPFHVCGVRTDDETVCWGMGGFGQLGVTTTVECSSGVVADAEPETCLPTPTPLNEPLTVVSSAGSHSCGLHEDGRALCWGALALDFGQLGTGQDPSATPTPVAGQIPFRRIVTAGVNRILTSTCGIDTDDVAWCWGAGSEGQLGAPPTGLCSGQPCAAVPLRLSDDLRFTDLSLGGEFACGVGTNARVYCWGRNDVGQLGRGTLTPATVTPLPVRSAAAS